MIHTPFTYASLCDGIGAVHSAWAPLGWRCAWTSEIEPFACAVVEHHWDLPNLGDMTKITERSIHGRDQLDLVGGGTPCQSFSLAGLRKGLADPRGNLALVFLGLVDLLRPRWVLWENVPGVLSSNRGRDFGCFLSALGQLGYGWCYRILDAQFFGVPQRRRRVFVVGHLGDWRPAAAVLFEPQSLRGNPAPGRKTRPPVARTLTSSTGGASAKEQQLTFVDAEGRPLNALCYGGGNTAGEIEVSTCLTHHGARLDFDTETFVTHTLAFDCKQDGRGAEDLAPTLRAMGHDASHANAGGQIGVAYPLDLRNAGRDADKHDAMNRQGCCVGSQNAPAPACTRGPVPGVAYSFQPRIGRSGRGQPSQVVSALGGASAGAGSTSDSRPCVASGYAVRRLTPRECERLQGFPDDYTLIQFRGKPAADGPRYRALGNSMAVPVIYWIGRRIEVVNRLISHKSTPAVALAGAMEGFN